MPGGAVVSVAGYQVVPFDIEREAFIDDLVGDVRGTIARRRDPAYGSLQITDEQVIELANAIVCNLIISCRVESLS